MAALAACALPVAPAQAGLTGGRTLLVSRPSGDAFLPMPVTNNSYVYGPAVDTSGNLVTFASGADILSQEDDNRFQNIFLRNRSNDTTSVISRASGIGGAAANAPSYDPAISPDGTKIAFASDADNLVDGDANVQTDIFLRDLTTNTTTLVSRADGPSGAQSNDSSGDPSVTVTNTGHVLVAFESDATNLVAGDSNNQTDVFLRDVTDGTTLLLSRANGAAGTIGNGMSRFGYLSADGSAVAFESYASNLDPDDSNTSADAYVRHLGTGTTELVSRATGTAGAKTNGQGLQPRLDATAGHVVFASEGTNLGVTGGLMHVYRRTLSGTYTTEPVDLADTSTTTAGNARAGSGCYSMNSDASKIAFCSVASNLVASPTDDNGNFDVYERDMGSNATTLISRATGANGAIGAGDSNFPWMSADAGVVIFGGGADNLSSEDDDAVYNVYARAGTVTELISKPSSTGNGTRDAMPGGVSRGGRFVVFQSDSDGLVDNDDDSVTNIYLRDNDSGTTTLLSRTQDGTAANGNSKSPVISADGSKVAFETFASNLGGDSNGQVVVKDIASGAVTVASLPDDATSGSADAEAHDPAISGDGSRVSFVSTAHNLVPGWTTAGHVYVRDLGTHDTIGADAVDGTASTPSDDAYTGRIDTSGTKVVFDSGATNLVPGVNPGDIFVYLRDLTANSTTIVSRDANGNPVKATEGHYSSDGPTVLFYAYTPLDPNDSSSTPYYARNLTTGAVVFIPRASGADGTRATDTAITPTLAADSRIVVFWSRAKELAAEADGRTGHVYYRDLNTFTTDAADRADGASGAIANAGAEFYPVISPDGCCIAFASFGSNLVSGWNNSEYFQAYVRDINPPPPDTGGGGGGGNPPTVVQPVPVTATPDKIPPVLKLGGALKQKPLKTKTIVLTVTSNEAATAKLGVTINIPARSKVFRLVGVTRKLTANKRVTVKVKVTKKALKALKRALRKKSAKIFANAKVTARDAAGNAAKPKTRKIRLVR